MNVLRSIGKLVTRHAYIVIVVWVILGVIAVPLTLRARSGTMADFADYLPDNIDSVEAERLVEAYISVEQGGSIAFVFQRVDGGSIIEKELQSLIPAVGEAGVKTLGETLGENIYYSPFTTSQDFIRGYLGGIGALIFSMNYTAHVLKDAPRVWVDNWYAYNQSDTSLSPDTLDTLAKNATLNYLDALLDTPVIKLPGTYLDPAKAELPVLKSMFLDGIFTIAGFADNWRTLRPDILAKRQTLMSLYTLAEKVANETIYGLAPWIRLQGAKEEAFFLTFNEQLSVLDFVKNDNTKFNEVLIDVTHSYLEGNNKLATRQLITFLSNGGNFSRFEEGWEAYHNNFLFGDPLLPGLPSEILGFPHMAYRSLLYQQISHNNSTLIVALPIADLAAEELHPMLEELRNWVEMETKSTGMFKDYHIFITGDAVYNSDQMVFVERDTMKIDIFAAVLILALLLLVFRSPVAAITPVLSIGIVLLMANAVMGVLTIMGVKLGGLVFTFMTVVTFGAGVDYVIFLLARFREEREQGKEVKEAVELAVEHAGESVTTSGGAVLIGFGAMALGEFEFFRVVGLGIVAGIGLSLLCVLTLIPSLVLLLGDRIFWSPKNLSAKQFKLPLLSAKRTARWACEHARAIIVVFVLVTIPAILITTTKMQTTYNIVALSPDSMPSKPGMTVIGEEFGAGFMYPTFIAVNFSKNHAIIDSTQKYNLNLLQEIAEFEAHMRLVPHVVSVAGPASLFGEPMLNQLTNTNRINDGVWKNLMREKYLDPEANQFFMLELILEFQAYEKNAFTVVNNLVDEISAYQADHPKTPIGDAKIRVGGVAAIYQDISTMMSNDFRQQLIIVLIGIYVILFFVLGSVLSPIRLILTVFMTVFWTFGLSTPIWGAQGYDVVFYVPVFLTTLAISLGIDYDIFITTRIREEASRGLSDRDALIKSLSATNRIIAICGVIMALTLGVLVTATLTHMKQIGVAMFLAISIDALIVRSFFVPAIMVKMNDWNWWIPIKRLTRVKPEKERITMDGQLPVDSE